MAARNPKRQKAEKYAGWLRPGDALIVLKPAFSVNDAKREILVRLKAGEMVSFAHTVSCPDDPEQDATCCELPTTLWIDAAKTFEPTERFWKTGTLEYKVINKFDELAFNCLDVRFDPDGLEPILNLRPRLDSGDTTPSSDSALPLSQEKPRHAGGRPRSDWWDGLWIEMCRTIYVEGFAPKRPADVENYMVDWLAHQGYSVAPTTVRSAARKLFAVLNQTDEN